MRKSIIAFAALSMIGAPALAQSATDFSGPRVGVTVGTGGNDFIDFDGQTIGIDAGYDWDLGNAVVGLGAEYQTDIGSDFLDVAETALLARAGAKVGSNALVYANGGYTHVSANAVPFDDGIDGYRVGVGAEFGLGNGGTTLKVEQRYLNYGSGIDAFQTAAGISFRF